MRVFTVLGPSQSGKTTLVKHLAGLEGGEKPETADHLALTRFSFLGEDWCAIDVIGGAECWTMVGGALMASDAVVLCVPADPDAALLAAPWLRAVEASGTPCFIFINKIDAAQGRVRDVVAALQAVSSHSLVLRQIPIRDGGAVVGAVDLISERAWRYREGMPSALVEIPAAERGREAEARAQLLESLSDFDDTLLEQLIEDRVPATAALYAIAAKEVQDTVIVPALLGAAGHHNGVLRLMKALRHETPSVDTLRGRLASNGKEPLAVAFHGQNRRHLGKITFLRALADGVAIGGQLGGGNLGGFIGLGSTVAPDHLAAGEIGLAVKSDQLSAGRRLLSGATLPPPDWMPGPKPMLVRLLTPASERDETRLSVALTRLGEVDPYLGVEQDPDTGQSVLRVQGPMQLRRVLERLNQDFGIAVEAGQRPARWKETISHGCTHSYRHRKQSGGAGQFADVSIRLTPRGRGEGFAFDEVVKGGAVPRNYIPAVEEGAREALVRGPSGFPVIDVGVTLLDGKHHAVDSSDQAFSTAGRMAVKEALALAGPVILREIDRVEIHVPSSCSGALVSLVSGLKGQVLGYDGDSESRGWDVFRALVPAAAEEDLIHELAAKTQGTGWYAAEFDHYEEVNGREAETLGKAQIAART
jgi:elongation factor G